MHQRETNIKQIVDACNKSNNITQVLQYTKDNFPFKHEDTQRDYAKTAWGIIMKKRNGYGEED